MPTDKGFLEESKKAVWQLKVMIEDMEKAIDELVFLRKENGQLKDYVAEQQKKISSLENTLQSRINR